VPDHRDVDAPILQLGQLSRDVHLAQREIDLGVRLPEPANRVAQQAARDPGGGGHTQLSELPAPHSADGALSGVR
jgi:hypothetical protein